MVFFKINSKSIKAPTEISLSSEVLDKAERTMDGTMVVDIIGRKDKVDVSWTYLADTDLRLLLSEISSGTFVTISYNTAAQQEIKTITARAESLNYMPYYNWATQKLMWQSVSVSFVER